MTSTLPTVESALYARLAGDPDVAAVVGDRVFNLQAPAGTPKPYIVFNLASGLLPNLTRRLDTNEVYRVAAVAESRQGADQLDRLAFAALHDQPLALAGFSNWWIAAERLNTLVENSDGRQIYRYIRDYRVQTSAT